MKILVHSQYPRAYKAALKRKVLSSVMDRMATREFQEAQRYGRATLKGRLASTRSQRVKLAGGTWGKMKRGHHSPAPIDGCQALWGPRVARSTNLQEKLGINISI